MHAAASMARSDGGLGHRKGVAIGSAAGVDGNESAGLDDAIESGAAGGQVFDDRESLGAPGLDRDRLAIFEMAHVKLAGGGAAVSPVRNAVNDQRAHAADAFAAVRIERNRLPALLEEAFVDHVEHFQERHGFDDIRGLVGFEMSGRLPVFLAPNFESQIHL